MVDLGIGAYEKMRVQNAAEAGAQYALDARLQLDLDRPARRRTRRAWHGVAVTSGETCYCITGSVIGSAVTCGSTCSDGSTAGTFVTVSTQVSYRSLVSYPGLANPMTLSGTAVVRIQ